MATISVERGDTTGFTSYEIANYVKESPLLELPKVISLLPHEKQVLFNRVFEVEVSNGWDGARMTFPDEMIPGLMRFRKDGESPDETRDRMEHQVVLAVRNRFTKQGAIYNPERLLRPRDPVSSGTYREDVEKARENCAFCNPLQNTPETEGIGRVVSGDSQSFANLTKFAAYHEVIIGSHDPFTKTLENFRRQIAIAQEIIRRVQRIQEEKGVSPHVQFALLGENHGPDAGASLLHQHMQFAISTSSMHFGEAERWHEISIGYQIETGRDFTNDWFLAHEMIGLGKKIEDHQGEVLAVADLTPIKDYGVVVIGPRSDGDPLMLSDKYIETCWRVEEFMIDEQGIEQFDTLLYLPPLERRDGYWKNFWPMFYFVARRRSDIAFMEIAGIPVPVDPKSFAPALFSHLQKAA